MLVYTHKNKMKILIESPELRIDSTQDGVWLHFKTSTGLSAAVNLPVVFGKDGTIVDKAINQWSKEFSESDKQK